MPSSPQLSAASKALHYSALEDIRVASDIAGAGASGEFTERGAPPEQIYGAALGTPGAITHSGYGIFTDDNGNTICVATESRDAWGMIKAKNLLGNNPYIFNIQRNMGEGGAFEANALMIAGGNGERYKQYSSWRDLDDAELDKIPGLTLQKYNDFPSLLRQIEQTGRKFDRPIVVLSSGEPITIGSILSKAFSIILAIAKPFASVLGFPPAAVDVLFNSLNIIATQGRFTVDVLADAAQLILPANFRSLMPQVKSLYSNFTTGNYLGAMAGLGITANALGIKDNLLKGDVSGLLGQSNIPVKSLMGYAESLFKMDTTKALAAANRSGSVITNLIDAGTMTKVPVLQNLLSSTTTDTLASALPGVSEIFQKVINETSDITNVDLHKGAIQAAIGHPVGADSFDELTLRGLKERANEMLENGKKVYVLPSTIPLEKRTLWGQEIADDVGISIIANPIDGSKTTPQTHYSEWY